MMNALSRWANTVVLATLTVLPAACASQGAGSVAVADQAYRRGDFDAAYILYRSALTEEPGNPLLGEKADMARRRAVTDYEDRARDMAAKGDLTAAADEIEKAKALAGSDAALEHASDRIAARKKEVSRQLDESRSLLDSGQAEKAQGILQSISVFSRTFPEIGRLEATARKRAAVAAAQSDAKRGEELLQEGSPLDAYRAFARAVREDATLSAATDGIAHAKKVAVSSALEEAESLERRGRIGQALSRLADTANVVGDSSDISAAEKGIRTRAATALAKEAGRELGAGRSATALLLSRAAKELDPAAKVPAAQAAVRKELERTLVLGAFKDGTGGRIDAEALKQDVAARLRKDPPGPWFRIEAGSANPDFTFDVDVREIAIEEPPPIREHKAFRYVVSETQEVNPQRSLLQSRLDELEQQLSDAKSVADATGRELEAISELELDPRVHGTSGRFFGSYTEAAYDRILGDARSRDASARQSVRNLESRVSDAQAELDGTPLYIDRKVIGRGSYTSTRLGRNLVATAVVDIRNTAEAESASSKKTIQSSVSAHDVTHPAVPQLGLKADPPNLPSAAQMAADLPAQLASDIVEAVRERLLASRRALAEGAEKLAEGGDEKAAVDRDVAFLLSVGAAFPLERRVANRRVSGTWGIVVKEKGLDLDGLELR